MTNESSPDPLAGLVVADRFELVNFAAKGGMGRVYRALDRATGSAAAVKLLGDERGDVARFEREAEVLRSIDHPGVVRYLAHGQMEHGTPYLAMEWLSGESLAQRLEDSTLSVDETLGLARRVAEALGAAHRFGVVHRDLKPANLFLVEGDLGRPKLLDFGVAYAADDVDLTATGVIVGTPAYMSPEQVRGEAVDARADVYGVGAVVFRCLTGRSPFEGAHRLAVLAKILIEPASQVRDFCPDVPQVVDALVTRLLDKKRERRPKDGAALASELAALSALPSPHAGFKSAAITASERRVASIVLCARGASAHDDTLPEGDSRRRSDSEAAPIKGDLAVRAAVEQRGGSVEALSGQAWAVTVPGAGSPLEQATRTARCALAIAAIRANAPVFVATGRVTVTGQHKVGEVIDRAADALVRAKEAGRASGVWVDATTAELLEGRFRFARGGEWIRLDAEEDVVAPVRMLLGKPAPCVGRETQLAMLSAAVSSCRDSSRGSAAVITAPPGLGKTHLLHEFLRAVIAPLGESADLLFARCDPMRSGSAFGMAGEIIKRAATILDSDLAPARAAKLRVLATGDAPDESAALAREEFLGEISGVLTAQRTASPTLRAARADTSLMADAVREAWVDWIAARAARRTVLFVVEDLQWADWTSMRLVDQAMAALEDQAVFFLATSRPEGAALISEGFRARGLVELTLSPLSRAASVRLVRGALGGTADDATVERLVQTAGGHPFHLEELVRAVSSGRTGGDLPATVLAMVEARLDELDARPRLVLRAASVFGDAFLPDGVAALMGDEMTGAEVAVILRDLVARELLTEERAGRSAAGRLRFRHALLREGAYATLADRDRARAHKRAARWLESTGEDDPAVLAEHYDRGESYEKASVLFRLAASQALHRNDFEKAMSHANRARARGTDEATDGALSAVEAEVHYWRGELPVAAERSALARQRLARGSREWFDAVSVSIGALGQLGRNDAVAERLEEVAAAVADEDGKSAQVVALCRGMAQLFWAHHGGELARLRARLDAVVGEGRLDPFAEGWVRRVRGESAWLHEAHVGKCLAELTASCDAFESVRAARALCLTQLNAACLAGWAGQTERGLEWLGRARVEAERLGAGFLVTYGKAVEGMLLVFAGERSAESVMRRVTPLLGGSPRLSFLCHVVVGWLAMDDGRVEDAEASVGAAMACSVAPELRAAGLALEARVAGARGRRGEGIASARLAHELEKPGHDLELTHGMAASALIELLAASGDTAGAHAVREVARARLEAIAATLDSDERGRFWRRPIVCSLV